LKSRGVDLAGLTTAAGRTFRWSGTYSGSLNEAKTLDTQLNVFATFQPELPPAYRDSEFVLLANIDPALQRRVLDQIRSPKLVVADTMNYWIENHRTALLDTLSRVNLVILNDAEARMLSGESNLLAAARAILAMGPQWVIVKKGEHGAMLVGHDVKVLVPAFLLDHVTDPTGAGDTFAGAFLGSLAAAGSLSHKDFRHALAVGTVVASYNIEAFSLGRLRTLTRNEISERVSELRALADLGAGGERDG